MSEVQLPRAVTTRLGALCRAYSLTDQAPRSLAALLMLLACDPFAPTAVRDPAAALDVHVADALVALELEEVRSARSIADLGSGAGLPGLVLAIVVPDARVTLVESSGRKCEFLGRAAEASGARNAVIANDRAESWSAGAGAQDLVTARALAPLNVVAEYAAPLLRTGGSLVVWTGRREADVESRAARAAEILGLSGPRAIPVEPFAGAQHHHLQLMTKLRDTPAGYPRRVGMARKRPLGVQGR